MCRLVILILVLVPLGTDAQNVTMDLISGEAAEAGPVAAVIRFTRTGNTNSALTVFVSRLPSSTAVTADISDNNSGFFTQLQQLSIPAGQASFDVEITPIADNLVEMQETLEIALATGSYTIGTVDSISITIADDPPVVTLVPVNLSAAENGADANIEVTRSGGNLAAMLRVQFAFGAVSTATFSDYSDNNNGNFSQLRRLDIPASQTTFSLQLTATPDNLVEGEETLDIQLAAGNYVFGDPAQSLVTFTDDAPVISLMPVALTTAEGGAAASIQFMRMGGSTSQQLQLNTRIESSSTAITADFVDNNNGNFLSLNRVFIAPGETSFELQLSAVQDGLDEGTETLDLSLADGAYLQSGTTLVSVTVLDALIFSDGFEPNTGNKACGLEGLKFLPGFYRNGAQWVELDSGLNFRTCPANASFDHADGQCMVIEIPKNVSPTNIVSAFNAGALADNDGYVWRLASDSEMNRLGLDTGACLVR